MNRLCSCGVSSFADVSILSTQKKADSEQRFGEKSDLSCPDAPRSWSLAHSARGRSAFEEARAPRRGARGPRNISARPQRPSSRGGQWYGGFHQGDRPRGDGMARFTRARSPRKRVRRDSSARGRSCAPVCSTVPERKRLEGLVRSEGPAFRGLSRQVRCRGVRVRPVCRSVRPALAGLRDGGGFPECLRDWYHARRGIDGVSVFR